AAADRPRARGVAGRCRARARVAARRLGHASRGAPARASRRLRAARRRRAGRDAADHAERSAAPPRRRGVRAVGDFESLPDVLGPGASGASVSWLQSALAELGFYTAEVQGHFDEATRDAVALFQKNRGLRSDGTVDARTQMSLYQALPRYTTPNLESNLADLA